MASLSPRLRGGQCSSRERIERFLKEDECGVRRVRGVSHIGKSMVVREAYSRLKDDGCWKELKVASHFDFDYHDHTMESLLEYFEERCGDAFSENVAVAMERYKSRFRLRHLVDALRVEFQDKDRVVLSFSLKTIKQEGRSVCSAVELLGKLLEGRSPAFKVIIEERRHLGDLSKFMGKPAAASDVPVVGLSLDEAEGLIRDFLDAQNVGAGRAVVEEFAVLFCGGHPALLQTMMSNTTASFWHSTVPSGSRGAVEAEMWGTVARAGESLKERLGEILGDLSSGAFDEVRMCAATGNEIVENLGEVSDAGLIVGTRGKVAALVKYFFMGRHSIDTDRQEPTNSRYRMKLQVAEMFDHLWVGIFDQSGRGQRDRMKAIEREGFAKGIQEIDDVESLSVLLSELNRIGGEESVSKQWEDLKSLMDKSARV